MSGKIKTIDLIVQQLPPAHDAIGEYTSFLASQLSLTHKTRILTSRDELADNIEGVDVKQCFSLNGKKRLQGLQEALACTNADYLVLQYNPFAWGKRGLALDLTRLIRRLRRLRSDITIATMFHERFPPRTQLRFRLMRMWQVIQFRSLCQSSEVNFFSTGLWAEEEKKRRPTACVVHLPVGANLPSVSHDRRKTRNVYGIAENALVLGIFGGAHVSKQLDWIRAAVKAVTELNLNRPVVALHVGGEMETVRAQLSGIQLIQTGRLSPADAASAIGAMDMLLNPLLDGTSTRRGSTIAGLQNGIAVVTTEGFNTEPLWKTPAACGVTLSPLRDQDAWIRAVCVLACNPGKQESDGRMNRKLFETHFDWPVIANSMMSHLNVVQNQKESLL